MQLATMNLQIATSKVSQALEDVGDAAPQELSAAAEAARSAGKTQLTVDVARWSRSPEGLEFLKALTVTDLTKQQRLQIASLLEDKVSLEDEFVKTPSALEKALKLLVKPDMPTVEVEIGGRWYPAPVSGVEHRSNSSYGESAFTSITIVVSVCGTEIRRGGHWTDHDFRDKDDKTKQVARGVLELLAEEGVRPTTKEAIEAQSERLERAERIKKAGLVVSVSGPALAKNKMYWWSSLEPIALGTKEKPRRCVVEPMLEANDGNGHYHQSYGGRKSFELPFVRVFSLELKKYLFVDVDEVGDYEWDEEAASKLSLPDAMHKLLGRIFDASPDKIFGDLFKGRHGGMVMLANGPQGTGKTLTAEVFAEKTRRPLYVLEMGELGTDLKQVEEALQRIFTRAARWNAVLLFDEADVFLAKRQEADLERSAIVGVFLRLLDRYEGMFFLTTNRAEVIDPAFRSRITLTLNYKPLTRDQRATVWDKMLAASGLSATGDMGPVLDVELDGRQIRNQVRLLTVIASGKEVPAEEIADSLQYAALNPS